MRTNPLRRVPEHVQARAPFIVRGAARCSLVAAILSRARQYAGANADVGVDAEGSTGVDLDANLLDGSTRLRRTTLLTARGSERKKCDWLFLVYCGLIACMNS